MADKPKQEKRPAHETLIDVVEELFRESRGPFAEEVATHVFTSGLNLALRLLQNTSFPVEHLPRMIQRLRAIEPSPHFSKENRLLAQAIAELTEEFDKAKRRRKAFKN